MRKLQKRLVAELEVRSVCAACVRDVTQAQTGVCDLDLIDPEGLNNPCSALPPEMIVHKYLPSLLEQDTTCCFHIILAVAACTQREVCVFTSQL